MRVVDTKHRKSSSVWRRNLWIPLFLLMGLLLLPACVGDQGPQGPQGAQGPAGSNGMDASGTTGIIAIIIAIVAVVIAIAMPFVMPRR